MISLMDSVRENFALEYQRKKDLAVLQAISKFTKIPLELIDPKNFQLICYGNFFDCWMKNKDICLYLFSFRYLEQWSSEPLNIHVFVEFEIYDRFIGGRPISAYYSESKKSI